MGICSLARDIQRYPYNTMPRPSLLDDYNMHALILHTAPRQAIEVLTRADRAPDRRGRHPQQTELCHLLQNRLHHG